MSEIDSEPASSSGRTLALELVRVTEAAALAAGRWAGRGDKEAGDGAAVQAMRRMLATADFDGVVVIGEGAKDAAPMLFDGEAVGSGRGRRVDVAVDPVEGTSLLARGAPDAIAVLGVAPRGSMWSPGPAFYMDKLVVGPDARHALHPGLMDAGVSSVLEAVAGALGRPVRELTVFVLDKPRHAERIADIRRAGARVVLRTDGDVAGALMAARPGSGVDLLMGIGGTPEGVIAACAVQALGGGMLARLAPQKPDEARAVRDAGLDLSRVMTADDLVSSDDVFFAATGITDGVLLRGVRYTASGATTESLVIRGRSGTVRTVTAEHRLHKLHQVGATD
jgi:fructose-1,6-bisphosphatase II